MSTTQFNIRLPERTSEQIQKLTKSTGMTQTQLMIVAIDRMFQAEERDKKMAKTTRERFIDQVAVIMFERVRQTQGAISFEEAIEDAKKVNDSEKGFTFDLREPGQRENTWSRHENVSLDEQEMSKAIEEAGKLI